MKLLSSTLFFLGVATFVTANVCSAQGWLTTVDYSRLKTELGGALETGAGVEVALAEADLNSTASIRQFLPDPANSAFAGKTLINASVNSNFTDTISGHATIVGGLIAGRQDSTLVPGVLRISIFDAADWLLVRSGFGTMNQPSPNPYLVHNHSYIANGFTVAQAEEASARFDFWMDRDGTLSTVGANNGLSSNLPQLLQQTHNAISVGRSNGLHSCGFTTLNGAGESNQKSLHLEARRVKRLRWLDQRLPYFKPVRIQLEPQTLHVRKLRRLFYWPEPQKPSSLSGTKP